MAAWGSAARRQRRQGAGRAEGGLLPRAAGDRLAVDAHPDAWRALVPSRAVITPGRGGLLALRLGRGRAAGGRGARLCLLGLVLGYEACFQEFVAQVLHDGSGVLSRAQRSARGACRHCMRHITCAALCRRICEPSEEVRTHCRPGARRHLGLHRSGRQGGQGPHLLARGSPQGGGLGRREAASRGRGRQSARRPPHPRHGRRRGHRAPGAPLLQGEDRLRVDHQGSPPGAPVRDSHPASRSGRGQRGLPWSAGQQSRPGPRGDAGGRQGVRPQPLRHSSASACATAAWPSAPARSSPAPCETWTRSSRAASS